MIINLCLSTYKLKVSKIAAFDAKNPNTASQHSHYCALLKYGDQIVKKIAAGIGWGLTNPIKIVQTIMVVHMMG